MTAKETVKGKSQVAIGRVKESVGRVSSNHSLQAKGIGDQVVGKARQAAGRVKDSIRAAKR